METLASASGAPANADNTAQAESTEADAGVENATGDGSAPSVPEADTPDKAPKKDAIQERIDKLTRDKYDALREADRRSFELQQRDAEIARLKALTEDSANKQVAPASDFPTLEQFGYDEGKYQAAVAAHFTKLATEQGRTAAESLLKQERERLQAEQLIKTWTTKEAEFLKSKPDYVEKVRNNPDLVVTNETAQVIRESPIGPQIAYYLGENTDAARAIAQLPPLAQAREIGRIEAKLEAAKAPQKPAVSQAPPPVGKVDADEGATVVKVDSADSDTLSDQEWTRRRNAQERARLRKARG